MNTTTIQGITFVKGTNEVLTAYTESMPAPYRCIGTRVFQGSVCKLWTGNAKALTKPLFEGWTYMAQFNTQGSGWDWYKRFLVFSPEGVPMYSISAGYLNDDLSESECLQRLIDEIVESGAVQVEDYA